MESVFRESPAVDAPGRGDLGGSAASRYRCRLDIFEVSRMELASRANAARAWCSNRRQSTSPFLGRYFILSLSFDVVYRTRKVVTS